jgi:Peptidase A4 family
MLLPRLAASASLIVAAVLLIAPMSTSAQDQSSRNWSGYVASNAYYSGVSALIETPVAIGQRPTGAAAVASWVGIGGTSSPDLIQAGVEVDTSGQTATYDAWFEMLPQVSRTTTLQVNPGDWVQVDVHEVDFDLWQITIVDGQQVFQTLIPYTSSHSSAEWIVEDPSVASGLVPLAPVTGTNFANMSAISNGEPATPVQLSAQPIVLVGARGQAKAVPSPLGPDGASFSVGSTP